MVKKSAETTYLRHAEVDSNFPTIKIIDIKSKEDLIALLDENGIDYSDWGNLNSSSKNTKNLDTLWKDLQNKDTWLAYVNGTLNRLVAPLNVHLYFTDNSGVRYKLVEVFQEHFDKNGNPIPEKYRERNLECVSEKLNVTELQTEGITQLTPEEFEQAGQSQNNFYERVANRAVSEELRQYDENDDELHLPIEVLSAEFMGMSVLESEQGFSYPTLPALYLAVGVKAELNPNLTAENQIHGYRGQERMYAYAEINSHPNGNRRRLTAFKWVPVDENDEVIRDAVSENIRI